MAVHLSIPSMLQESLVEMVLVADYCVSFRKDQNLWGTPGCYGYPAAVLLLSIADSIGSYILGGNTRNHFDILKHQDYYNLSLRDSNIEIIYKKYRNLLAHNSVMATDAILDIGNQQDPVFEIENNNPILRLFPFLVLTKEVVKKFLQGANSNVLNNQTLQNILRQ